MGVIWASDVDTCEGVELTGTGGGFAARGVGAEGAGEDEAAGAGEDKAAGAGEDEAAGAGEDEAAGAGEDEAAAAFVSCSSAVPFLQSNQK